MFDFMQDIEVIALGVSFLVACLGYLATYIQSIRLQQRENRLQRINRQLREFYGPVYAIVSASKTAYSAFMASEVPEGHAALVERVTNDPMSDLAVKYREWMAHILMPLNERCWALIVDHADLFDAPNMPPFFLQFVAHVSAYRLILRRWERGDYSEHFSVVRFPGSINDYVRKEFTRLKVQQAEILGVDAHSEGAKQQTVIEELIRDQGEEEERDAQLRRHWSKLSSASLTRRRVDKEVDEDPKDAVMNSVVSALWENTRKQKQKQKQKQNKKSAQQKRS